MIHIRGARQHNLAGIDLDLPTTGITVLCGRSGSGKSSLAFDTVHAEAWRRYLEAMAGRSRAQLPQLPRPDVDHIDGLPPTVALEQGVDAPGGGSTVATFAELSLVLRVLFGRVGVQHDPVTGDEIRPVTHDQVVAAILALPEGSRLTLEAPVRVLGPAALEEVGRAGFSRVRLGGEVRTLDSIRPEEVSGPVRVVVDRLRVDPARKDRLYDAVRTATAAGQGTVVVVSEGGEQTFVDRPYSVSLERVLPERSPRMFRLHGTDPCAGCMGGGFVAGDACARCEGTGIGDAGRAVRLEGWTWGEVMGATIDALLEAADGWIRTPVNEPLLEELRRRAAAVVRAGLGGLRLSRPVASLSAGEWQALRLARLLGSDLSGVLYVLDEPMAGLDLAGAAAVVEVLCGLCVAGNGVLLVEHHPLALEIAERVVEFGPGPGAGGGRVVYDGAASGLWLAETATGRALRGLEVPTGPAGSGPVHVPAGEVHGRDLPATELRRGALNAVVGPRGCGKSLWLGRLHEEVERAVAGQGPMPVGLEGVVRVIATREGGGSRGRRSIPATYVGLWDTVREMFAATQEARLRGLGAAAFSLNVKGGRCEACRGLGENVIELDFLPEVRVPCDVCEGRRFAQDVLAVRYKGLDAGAILDLTADEAAPLLAGHPRIEDGLRALREVGLGYLPLGQPTDSLSGGEVQRLRLARELVRAVRSSADDVLYLLDEPTIGLHPEDVVALLRLLISLAETGATVVVASHHPLVRRAAAQVVELAS